MSTAPEPHHKVEVVELTGRQRKFVYHTGGRRRTSLKARLDDIFRGFRIPGRYEIRIDGALWDWTGPYPKA